MSVTRIELMTYLQHLLCPALFQDYCPNGLQVEGKSTIKKLVTGVSASKALLDAAVLTQADAILVHHGYFWKNEAPEITGMKRTRLGILLKQDINLFAYHLPLDAHAVYGNNVQLGEHLGFQIIDNNHLVFKGKLSKPISAEKMSDLLATRLNRQPLSVAGGNHPIETVAWCTGAAQNYIFDAIAAGVDAFITGEASEQTVHVARENGIHFFAAGHHATERYGVKALGTHLSHHFGIEHEFIDIDNPV